MKKITVLLVALLLVASFALVACAPAPAASEAPTATEAPAATEASAATEAPAATEAAPVEEEGAVKEIPPGLVIGMIPITLANGYHQADIAWCEEYALEKYGAIAKVLDGKFEQPTIVANLDQLIAEGVDAIILHTYEAESVEAGVDAARAAGIPIITFYLETDNNVPFVAINEASAAEEMGKVTATQWLKAHPDQPIIYSVVDYVDSPVVQAMRTQPFIKGLKSVAPDAKEGKIIDGGGTRDTGYKAAQDIIQSAPETNVFYGASSDYSLAILPALEEAGRGKAVDGVPETEILVGTDATGAELVAIYNPSSSFKVTMGLTPRENGMLKVDTIMQAWSGAIDPDKKMTVEATDKEIDFWNTPLEEARTWYKEEYRADPEF